MRLATRTFYWSFVPIALLLVIGFWATRATVNQSIRQTLRLAARNNQLAVTRERAKVEARLSRILRGVGVNADLAEAVQQLLAEHRDPAGARRKVEQELTNAATYLGFDAFTVFDVDGIPRAGVMRLKGHVAPLDPGTMNLTRTGLLTEAGQVYELSSISINKGTQVLGSLAVGDRFDLAQFAVPLVLLRNGGVMQSSARDIDSKQIETAFAVCAPEKECEVRLKGESYLSIPLLSGALEDAVAQGYSLRTLQSVDAGVAPLQATLRKLFLFGAMALLTGAFLLSILSSRSIVRPISTIIEHLCMGEKTGVLPEFRSDVSRIHEMRELAERFGRAARAVREGRENLVQAYVQFTGSLASALDARDPYTAGHSRRVSDCACAIARSMNLPDTEIEIIRIGALLHDIGKIGIPDALLLKPGKLTVDEAAHLREHPVIGRRILEGVHGFQNYLHIVELHHENWDGTGYPRGLKGEETPLSARIVKVADTYDAMTSDRPYRPGMRHARALEELRAMTGIHVDPEVMAAFERIQTDKIDREQEPQQVPQMDELLGHLDRAVRDENVTPASAPEMMEAGTINREQEPVQGVPMERLLYDLDGAIRPKEEVRRSVTSLSAVRVTLPAINEQLNARGYKARLKEGDGYFYFSSGETLEWVDRTVRVPTLNSLTLEQWLQQFEKLKQVNRDILMSGTPRRT